MQLQHLVSSTTPAFQTWFYVEVEIVSLQLKVSGEQNSFQKVTFDNCAAQHYKFLYTVRRKRSFFTFPGEELCPSQLVARSLPIILAEFWAENSTSFGQSQHPFVCGLLEKQNTFFFPIYFKYKSVCDRIGAEQEASIFEHYPQGSTRGHLRE